MEFGAGQPADTEVTTSEARVFARASAAERAASAALTAAETRGLVEAAALDAAQELWLAASFLSLWAECLVDPAGRYDFVPIGRRRTATASAVDVAARSVAMEMLEASERLSGRAHGIADGGVAHSPRDLDSKDAVHRWFRASLADLGRINRGDAARAVEVAA